MYLTKEQIKKILSVKRLHGLSIAEFCSTPEFLDTLGKYFDAQKEEHSAMRSAFGAIRKMGGGKGMKVPAHVLDHLVDWTTERLRDEYVACINKTSTRSAAEREYILQLGMQAYNVATVEIICAEYPDLRQAFNVKALN